MKTTIEAVRRVIIEDSKRIVEFFDESQTVEMLNKYNGFSDWDNISIDDEGNIILSKKD